MKYLVKLGAGLLLGALMLSGCSSGTPATPERVEVMVTVPVVETRVVEVTREVERTVVVTGATASACVRATVEDAIADGFRPIIVRECIGDRIAGAVEWNLYDMDAKFGDVESLDEVLEHLRRNV